MFDKVCNTTIQESIDIESLLLRFERSQLRRFGHVSRITQKRLSEQTFYAKVNYWVLMNKLTLNYSKCKYMVISKTDIDTSLFTLKINNLSIKRADCIQCLRVLLDDKLS